MLRHGLRSQISLAVMKPANLLKDLLTRHVRQPTSWLQLGDSSARPHQRLEAEHEAPLDASLACLAFTDKHSRRSGVDVVPT
jgi:hypothetical protein